MLQKLIQDAIDEQVSSGREAAVQVAVYRNGSPIVDAVAGPATSSTIFYTWSMGKAMTSTIVHLLVARGAFGYDTPIAAIWPEFAAAGKSGVTVRHVLHHTAGVPGIGASTTAAELCDWELICARIAAMPLWWEPGTRSGYHAYTFGYILGEVCRRATGRTLRSLLREEIGEPLGAAGELWFGMPESEHHRLEPLVDAPPPPGNDAAATIPPDSPMARSASVEVWPTAALGTRTDVLAADIPAGGKMTARAIARMYAALIGEVDGVRLLSPATLDAVLADRFEGTDEIFGNPVRWALGYSIGGIGGGEGPSCFGFGGAGGTFGCADPSTGIAFAYVKNRQTSDFSSAAEIARIVTGWTGEPRGVTHP